MRWLAPASHPGAFAIAVVVVVPPLVHFPRFELVFPFPMETPVGAVLVADAFYTVAAAASAIRHWHSLHGLSNDWIHGRVTVALDSWQAAPFPRTARACSMPMVADSVQTELFVAGLAELERQSRLQ